MTDTPTLAALDQAEREQVQQNDAALMRRDGQTAAVAESELIPDIAPYAGASQLNLTEQQQRQLMALIRPDVSKIQIRPDDGMLFLPQVEYRRALLEIFGPGNWALVPMSDPKGVAERERSITIAQKFQLRIYGKFVAEAWGEGDYNKANPKQSKATAAEAARSNALVRCCKDLGIGLDLWDHTFAEKFKREYCRRGDKGWERKPDAQKT